MSSKGARLAAVGHASDVYEPEERLSKLVKNPLKVGLSISRYQVVTADMKGNRSPFLPPPKLHIIVVHVGDSAYLWEREKTCGANILAVL